MGIDFSSPQFEVLRDENRCIQCRVCEKQCANKVHSYDEELNVMKANDADCVNCHRCVALCPTKALRIRKYPLEFRENANWTAQAINEIYKQADTGTVLLTSMGNPKPFTIYWDKMLLNASQVTNPSIDPLREPMETKVMIGAKPDKLEYDKKGKLISKMPAQLELNAPILFSAMSYGSISRNAH